MTRSLFRFAALMLCAGLLFTGCTPTAPSASSAPASSAATESDAPAPTTIPLPDPLPEPLQPTDEELAALTDAIEAGFRADWDRPGRYLSARLDSVRVIPPEEWEDLQLPLTSGNTQLEGKSWMDCITAPGGCLLMAQTDPAGGMGGSAAAPHQRQHPAGGQKLDGLHHRPGRLPADGPDHHRIHP